MKVTNITNSNGNKVANQFIIQSKDEEIFQSYETPIAKWKGGEITISQHYNYSRTTAKYFRHWMRSNGFNDTEIDSLRKLLANASFGANFIELLGRRVNIKYVERV